MLNLYKTPSHQPSHERLFIERYTRLRQWALHLTASNGDQAEDLVHDAFIQFTLARPDLATIHNLDGYLYGMLRNLHVSQLRRLSRLGYRSLSMIDYDSIEIGLRATDPRDLIRSQDELRQLCYYACVRKETSKAGSVLILRFLLGYYPREIAQVMCTTRQAVEERLRIARSEAKYYVQNPGTLRFLPEQRAARPAQAPTGFAQSTGELLHDLQRTVFAARTGDCLPPDSLKQLYSANPQTPLNGHTLSHLVSCPPCLDAANKHLGIPVLAERYPTDTLGSDTQRGGGSSSNNDGGGSSSSNNGGGGDNGDNGDNDGGGNGSSDANQSSRSLLRRAKQVFEHRPQELCIAVNGDLIAAQRISAALSEQTLKINTSERIEFIEIISEQEVRLLFLSVADAAKQDKLKSPLVQRQQSVSEQQSIKVELSDQRTLEVTLSFDKPWPTLHVSYYDPAMDSEAALIVDSGEWRVESGEVSHDAAWQSLRQGSRRHTGTAAAWMQSWLVNVFGAHPAVITAALAVLLIAAVLFIRLHATTVSAADLLRQSTAAEHTRATRLETILHRTIELEERRHGAAAATDSSNNTSVVRRRIEVWQSASSNLTMRRVYDERGRLVAGERGASVDDSSSTLRRIIYRVGDAPQTLSEPAALEINRSLDPHSSSIWRLDPSAEVFTALVGDANRSGETSIEERLGTYLVRFKRSSTLQPTAGLLEATLMLTKTDLRPINQVLVVAVRNGSNGAADETREYRFVESKFEQLQAHLVPPSVFEPEAELLRFTEVANKNAKRVREAATLSQTANDEALQSATSSSELFIPAASAELEVEATYLLNKVKANLGEQVSVARTGESYVSKRLSRRKGVSSKFLTPLRLSSTTRRCRSKF